MSFANPLCHKLSCPCRSWITVPPQKNLVHRDLAARFNTKTNYSTEEIT